jgi:hypothetical protein
VDRLCRSARTQSCTSRCRGFQPPRAGARPFPVPRLIRFERKGGDWGIEGDASKVFTQSSFQRRNGKVDGIL